MFGLVVAATTASAAWCASPIASGDRPADKAAAESAASGVRNYDWLRPRPEDVTPNPLRGPAGRPFLKDVRPWKSDVEFRIQAPPIDWTEAKERDEEEARWRRPTPQEIAPNPRRGVGARPYLRNTTVVRAPVQRDVRDYGAGTVGRAAPDIAAPTPSGTQATPTQSGTQAALDATKPAGAGGTKPGDPADASAGPPTAKPEAAGMAGPPTQGAPGTPGAAADQPAQSAGGESAPGAAGTGAAASQQAPSAAGTGMAAGQQAPSAAGTGAESSGTKAGGGQQAGGTGQQGGGQQPGGTGQQAGGEPGGKDKESAAGASPDLREYLAGTKVAARDGGDELAQKLAALFGPIPERQAAQPVPAPPAANAGTAAPPPSAAPASWWQRVIDLFTGLWTKIFGGDDPTAPPPPTADSQRPPSALDRSVRGDVR